MNREQFIEKAKKRHGDKYDYLKVNYTNSTTKVCIICPEHGEFWQTPSAHIRGNGCPKCSNYNRGRRKRWDTAKFIEESKKIHGDKYDYSKVNYVNSSTLVNIICPQHGEFSQTPLNHLKGQGCPKCAGRNYSTEEIIEEFKKIHGNKYDYSRVEYKKMHEKVCIICPEHGEFWQTPSKHLNGQGCPKCRYELRKGNNLTREEFLKRAIKIHGDKYDYSKVSFENTHDKITIKCKKHGEFTQYVYDHLNGHGCPHCAMLVSKAEEEIYKFICNIVGWKNVISRDRSVLDGKELDIYIPSMKIAIEYNSLLWHSEDKGKGRNYHLNKTEECNKKGIKLIQIFEDEYLQKKDLVFSKLSHLLGKEENLPSIMARKCEIMKIHNDIAKEFLERFHIQGYSNSTLSYGAYFKDILVGVMTFTKTGEEGKWVLSRFATNNTYKYSGLGSKMFKFFIKENNPISVKSFADRRWTVDTNNLYQKMGFTLTEVLKPDYKYISKVNPQRRIHKFNLRKKEIYRKYNLPMSMTESQMVEILGLSKIWDCGLYKYEWKKETSE